MPDKLVLGPILGFRGQSNGSWNTSALIVVDGGTAEPEILLSSATLQHHTSTKSLLKTLGNKKVWRFDWSITQQASPQEITYKIVGLQPEPVSYTVPGVGQKLRIAYGSCFGFHSMKDMKKVNNKAKMFQVLNTEHQQNKYHLFFMGGDQVYADLIWDSIPELSDWFDMDAEDRNNAFFSEKMRRHVEKYYFDLYCKRWSEKNVAGILSQIPSLMMWDDHDIFDGWGSYPVLQHGSDVMQGIFGLAREHFLLFQQQAKDPADLVPATLLPERGCTFAYRVDDIAIIGLDMRSERTQDRVMGIDTWNAVYKWLADHMASAADGSNIKCRHLLIFSSIPVVYVNLNMVEDVFNWIPGQQEMEDDFKDQWISRTHQEERLRLIHRLLKISNDMQCRTTIISGDVHVAALGYIESSRSQDKVCNANVINQLVSSAMVNVPPPRLITYMLERILGDKVEEIDRGIIGRMMKFPGTSKRFIGGRNFLSLTLDEQSRIWAEWFVEGEKNSFTKVIHPVE